MFSTITFDLTAVTDALTALGSALTGASGLALAIGAGIGVGAVVYGGVLLYRVFKKFAK